jgi:hypothetical protein
VSESDEKWESIANDVDVVKFVKDAKVVYDDQGGMLMTSVFEQGPESSLKRRKPQPFVCKENGCGKKYRSKQSLKVHFLRFFSFLFKNIENMENFNFFKFFVLSFSKVVGLLFPVIIFFSYLFLVEVMLVCIFLAPNTV